MDTCKASSTVVKPQPAEYTGPVCTLWSQADMPEVDPTGVKVVPLRDLEDTSVVSECSLGVNLVIDNLLYVASCTSPLYTI